MKRAARGYVLLPVAVAIALIGIIAYLTATESAMETRLGAGAQDRTRAEYVAQAGLQHALRHIGLQGCGPFTGLNSVAFDADLYSASLSSSLGSTTKYRIEVDADSWIRSDQPTVNKASDAKLHTRNEAAGIERPLLRYDLSPIPDNAPILSATAWFYVTNEHPQGPIDIHLNLSDWIEDEVTWESMSASMDTAVVASIPSQPGNNFWLPVNLSAQVQAWVNGQLNRGIALNSTADGVHGQYNSRESANPPYLEVVVGSASNSLAQLQARGSLRNGVSHSISRDITLRQQPASFSQFRLGTGAGADAVLSSFFAGRNYGDKELQIEAGGSQTKHALLRFDLAAIPPDAKILSARLELYHDFSSAIQTNPAIDIHRVTRDWIEGTSTGVGLADGATWNTWDGSNDWIDAGGDYASVAVTSSPVSDATGDWESWEIGELVRGWLEGRYPNYGLLLKGSGDIDMDFASKEDANAARHPRLSIEYACACGQVCATPQGNGRILMAVVNPTTLVADDVYKKALFESWGFKVSVISESANQASYDTAMASADVVFISETVNSAQLGNKLAVATIGVVSQDGDYNADLGIASGAAWPIGTAIDITDSSHYITAPFPTGSLRIYNAAMEQLSISGSGATGLQTLADSAGNSSLVVLESAALLSGGGTAAGRRVMLPLGRTGLFNWEQLNGNGRLLLQRALTWGARLDDVAENLLLVVANPGALTASETARKSLFESWGYEVSLIGEADTQTSFNAAIAANDVAYVAVDVDAASLANKLSDAGIGIVSEEAELGDELGIAESALYRDRNQIDIVDNSHFITEPFATGLLSFVDSVQPVHMLGVNTAPGLMTLAQSLDNGINWRPSLMAIEVGGQLWGGANAAGRRVQLPWGGEGFDIDQLNDDGRSLLQRALRWANSSAGGGPPIAHWKLDESGGVIAPDSIAANDGTLVNSPGWTPGLLQGSLDFDGSNDRVDIGSVADLDKLFGSGATLTGWIYARDWGESSRGRIADKSDSTNLAEGWMLRLDGGDEAVVFESGFTGSSGAWSTPDGSISLGRWHHLALVYNGSSVSNVPAIYIDGVVQTPKQDSTPSGTLAGDAAYNLTLGNHATADSRTFDGKLDDIRLYDRMLSAAQVAELAQFPGPIAHWQLDEGTGTNAFDSVGDNDGILVDGPTWTAGAINDALDFDGVDDLVTAGTFDVVGSGITMMAWFRADTLGTDEPRLLSKADGNSGGDTWWQLNIADDGPERYLQMRIKADGSTTKLDDDSTEVSTEEWHFAAATYDADSGEMKLYLDGTEVASRTHSKGGPLAVDAGVGVAIGANATGSRLFDGIIDDPRVYDYALTASHIQAIFDAVEVPDDIAYRQRFESWSATEDNEWQTVDLSAFDVPAGAVAEVLILNSKDNAEREGGVRAVGSVLERRIDLNEVEEDGRDTITMHVQVDASSQIEHYSEKKNEVKFVLLGYWSGVSYTELFSEFSVNLDNTWVAEDLSDNGVAANLVAEIAIVNDSASREYLAGVRSSGSSLQRSLTLKEAESGGVDAVSMMVNSGPAATVEVFAESDNDVEFYVLGYWASAPGVYTELGGDTAQVAAALNWQPTDLSGFSIPADAVAHFALQNGSDNSENRMGLRQTGSSDVRLIELQEAESGGFDAVSLHVNVDASGLVEWYSESGDAERLFHPIGWWLLTP